MLKNYFTILIILLLSIPIKAQKKTFSRQDSLRGGITKYRKWWDLTHYDLSLTVNPKDSSIQGTNIIEYQALKDGNTMQIDLQKPMSITKVSQDNQPLSFIREGNVYFINLDSETKTKEKKKIIVEFSGKPKVSENPPWSGGLVWAKDESNNDFIATACQGDGASLWWPCKDHMYDEVDSMNIHINSPKGLMSVSNGKLSTSVKNEDGSTTYSWKVKNPINNYGVNVNIGDYVKFSEKYNGEKGLLECNYYVLKKNKKKAKKQFKQVKKMFDAFEYWFGPYPFYEDGYKLVEVPYLGMEHQSSVTYGNQYKNGYRGKDLSGTGWGLKFDFIIIHESGHEWFANNITNKDIADMWIHESFTSYSETLFLDYHYGKEAGNKYVVGTRKNIRNDRPIIGKYDVNYAGSGDMYYKGANMLHTLRQLIDDDEKWRKIIRGMSEKFYHQTVTTKQIESYLSDATQMDLSSFFNQYLRTTKVPLLEYKIQKDEIQYRWANVVTGFEMPIEVSLGNKNSIRLFPTNTWKVIKSSSKKIKLKVDTNYYVEQKEV